jgi:hypothetical protein
MINPAAPSETAIQPQACCAPPPEVAWAGVDVVNVAALGDSVPAGETGCAIGAAAMGATATGGRAGLAACTGGRPLNATTASL